MNSELRVATTREFNGITLRCYQEYGQEDSADFWATREQIGQILDTSIRVKQSAKFISATRSVSTDFQGKSN